MNPDGEGVLLDLVQNLALLVAMAAAYRIVAARWNEASRRHQLYTGLLFGLVALVGMMTPVHLMEGLLFDGRSIVLGVAGFVGGPVVALVAAGMAGAYRASLGGVGVWMGLAVIAESAAFGVAFHSWRRRTGRTPGLAALVAFGLAIHLVMAALLLTLPGAARALAWRELGAAILVAYPLATVLVCKLFLDYERRDRDEAALEESEARLRALWASVGDAVIATDASGGVTHLNPAAEALTGWPSGEAVGRPVSEIVRLVDERTGEDVSGAFLSQVPERGSGSLSLTAVLVRRDGTPRPVEESIALVRDSAGTVSGLVVVFRDRTAEGEVRRALLESRQRMALALDGAELGTWDWNIETGAVTCNARWAEMVGLEPVGTVRDFSDWSERVHPADLPRVMEVLEQHLAGITSVYETEHRLRHASGGWVWVLDRGRVLERARDGRPLRASGTHLDVTARKAAEMERKARQERLEEQNRVLLGLMGEGSVFSLPLKDAVQRITEAGAALLGSERAGFWWYGPSLGTVHCWDRYEASSGVHTGGETHSTEGQASYVEAHRAGEVVSAPDVWADPRTQETAQYLQRHRIRSLLDAPVWLGSQVVGILSFETVTARRDWSPEDERLAATLSVLLSVCLEAADRARAEAEVARQVVELKRAEEELRASLAEADRSRRALLSALEDREQVAAALREREEVLSLFIEHAPAALSMFDREMTCLAASRRWFADFGVGPEVVGRSHYESFPEIGEAWREGHRRALAGEVVRRDEDLFPGVDGRERWVRWEARPWFSAGGEVGGIIIAAEDLSERKRAARELEQFKGTLDLTLDSVFLFDPESLRFTYVNEGAVRQVGYSREELLGMHPYDIKPEYPEDAFRRMVAPLVAGEAQALAFETVHRHRDGHLIPVDVTLQLVTPEGAEARFVAVVRDATQRRIREEALRSSEERYRELFHTSPQILWVYDVETLALMDVNEAALRHYGYGREEFLAMTIADIRPPEDVPALRERVAHVTGGMDEAGIWRHLKKDGTVIDVEIRSHGLEFAGRPAELVMVTDVTERLRQEARIRALTEGLEDTVRERTRQLREANAELESFSYTVSHDLKAPLRAIDGYSALLEESVLPTLDPEDQRLVREVRRSAQQMGSLIEDLLAFSRVGRAALTRDAVALGPLVHDLVERECQVARGRRIEVEVPALPEVWGDPGLIRQAFDNIVGNAVKFTRTREVARISVSAARRGEMVEVSVRDNGVGFDTRYRQKLFRVFERLHYPDEFEGTGVGLAIVKRIVERHGGRVEADSELGSGTVITLTLPAVPEGTQASTAGAGDSRG